MENEHLEGRHALAEALDAHVPVQVVYANDAAFRDKRASKLLARAQADGIRIERATGKELDAYSSHGAHQGIVAQPVFFGGGAFALRETEQQQEQ